jgi:UrcA family protein
MKTPTNGGKSALQQTSAMLAGVCATLLFVHSTQAAEFADEPRREVVGFADLNLSNIDGVTVLYRRIHSAAIRVCGSVDQRELARAAAAKSCVDHAVTEAIVAVNNPVVTNRFLAKADRSSLHLATVQTPSGE